jgi:hypothetical protein
MDLREVGCDDVNWIQMARDRSLWWASVKMVMNLWVSVSAGSFLPT